MCIYVYVYIYIHIHRYNKAVYVYPSDRESEKMRERLSTSVPGLFTIDNHDFHCVHGRYMHSECI